MSIVKESCCNGCPECIGCGRNRETYTYVECSKCGCTCEEGEYYECEGHAGEYCSTCALEMSGFQETDVSEEVVCDFCDDEDCEKYYVRDGKVYCEECALEEV